MPSVKQNRAANKILKKIYADKDIRYCELRFPKCWRVIQGFAHRHKRGWYNSRPELLADFNQTLGACNSCHQVIEDDAELTEKMFEKLRPEGDIIYEPIDES